MHPYQKLLDEGLAFHKAKQFKEAEQCYNRVLNRAPYEEAVLFLLSDLYLRKECNGLAINLLSNLLQNNPKHAAAWNNLGIAFRKENSYDFAKAAYLRSIEEGGETAQNCSNLAGLYADRSEPFKALEWLDKALALDPDNADALWDKALAVLSLRRWDEGWKLFASRQRLESWDARKTVDCPLWDGSPVKHLYIHGEQGVGDEIMFASAIPYVKAERVTVEVNPKVAGIIKQTWPHFEVVKEATPGKYDAKIPIGSLIGMFGMNSKPYLEPHPKKVEHYRKELEALGPGPYIALTWIGGTKATRAEERIIALGDLAPIRELGTCVSAQYSNDTIGEYVDSDLEKYGLPRINQDSSGGDLHDQAALFRAVDAVVTVQQTAVHVAGAVGAKTYAIIGSHPHWRYGLEGDSLPFYKSVSLFRRKPDMGWDEVVNRVKERLSADLGLLQEPKRAVA